MPYIYQKIDVHTYLRSWALLEKLLIVQPLKNFPVFYGAQRFITMGETKHDKIPNSTNL
jgi:hypothetical protein